MAFPNVIPLSPGEELRQTEGKRQALGTVAETPDGRVFVYARAGEALDVGIPCQAAGMLGGLEHDTNAKLVTSITTYAVTASYLRISTTWGSPGGSTGVTKNMFRDGFVWVDSGTGAGQMMRIKENTTGSSGTASQSVDLKFRDDERLHEAIDTQVLVAVMRNQYDSIIEYDGLDTITGRIVGVAPRDVTSAYYFWLQKKGPCPVLTDGTVVLGDKVIGTTSTGVQGAGVWTVDDSTGADFVADLKQGFLRQTLGTVLLVAADTKYSLIDLDL